MPRSIRQYFRGVSWLICGLIVFWALSPGSFYLPAAPFDAPVKLLFRVVFWAAFPMIMIVRSVWRDVDHHTQIGALALASMLTPLMYWGLWRLVRRRWRPAQPAEAGGSFPRRVFLKRSAAVILGASAIALPGYAVCIGPQRLRIRRYRVRIKDLPPALDALRIVQVSDTHLGPYVQLAYLHGAMETVNSLSPDLILLTGDYVHRSPLNVDPGIELLGRLRARLGIVAVLGNHDHWEGADACRAAFSRIGIPLIDNSRVFLTATGLSEAMPARMEEAICIGGVGDHWEDEILPEQAFREVPASMPRLLLTHNPDALEEIDPRIRIDLALAGHTHGGQIAIPGLGPLLVPSAHGRKYEGGLCQSPAGPVLVSRGVGMTVLPIRMFVPPEISEITLG